jgi:hypothetical protein
LFYLPYNKSTTNERKCRNANYNQWRQRHRSLGQEKDWIALKLKIRFLLVAGLSVGIVLATPALAFEPKMIVIHFQPRDYARTLVLPQQFSCLDKLVKLESHWNARAKNPTSRAFGIFQFLPTTWGNYNLKKTANPYLQIKYGLHYIKVRYGTPCKALEFHLDHGWY